MRRLIVECENGDRYEHQLVDGERLKVTGKGAVWFISPGEKPIPVAPLDAPVAAIYELVRVDG